MNAQPRSYSIGQSASETKSASPCDEAYADLRAAQERAEACLAGLIERLDVVLSPEPPPVACISSGATPVAAPATSEMHGRFMAATDRLESLGVRIRAITNRLTV